MAIDKVKKALFFIPNDIYDKFIVELKAISSVEIIEQKEEKKQKEPLNFQNFSIESIKSLITKIEFILTNTSKYTDIKLILPKIEYNVNLTENEIKYVEELFNKVETIDREIKSSQSLIHSLNSKLEIIEKFKNIDLDIQKLKLLKKIKYYFLKLTPKDSQKLLKELNSFENCFVWTVNKTKDSAYLFVLLYVDFEEKFNEITKKYEVNFLNILEISTSNTIRQEVENKLKEIENEKQKIENLTTQLKEICKNCFGDLYKIYIKCLEIQDILYSQQNMVFTNYIKILTCWVPNKFIKKINELIKKYPQISIIFFEAQKDEDIPTVLENKKIFSPYEFITTLYGYPKTGTVDPTELLAPFFTIFFALCLSDIFYGFLLLSLWLFLRKKVHPASEYYKLIVLFKYLGIISVFIGIFLDSFLGFSLVKNFKFPLNLALFDPLNRPIDMLKFTFALGFVQVIFGLAVSAVKDFKNKEFLNVVDSISWMFFIISFAPIVYSLFFPLDVPQNLKNVSSKISLILFLFIVIFQSRDIKPILLKPVNIFVKAYNTIGFYADMLSYSRILALALASSAIAQTMNLLVAKLLKAELLGIKYVEPAVAPLLFVGGHIFNFLMGVLGGLVHSARLQYLEFFSKFFVSGGRPIKIFSPIKFKVN